MTRLRAIFRRSGRAQLTAGELQAAGVDAAAETRRGRLRSGVCGYWLPAAADPGALLVMAAAIGGAL